MLPLADHNPTRSRPVVTWLLIAANLIAFLYEKAAIATLGERFVFDWGFVPARFLASPIEELPTLLTSMFLHGGLMHLLGNLWFLYIFGDNVEEALGKARYVAFYLVSGVVAAFAQLAIDPASVIPMVGASGAIAGVLGGYALRYPRAPVTVLTPFFFAVELPAWLVIGLWFVVQVVSGVGSLAGDGGGVAFFAHIGGLLAGLAMMALVGRPPPRPRRPVYVLRGDLDDWRPPPRYRY